MARSDLIVDMVEAQRRGDGPRFRLVVEALIAEERSNQHHLVADPPVGVDRHDRRERAPGPRHRSELLRSHNIEPRNRVLLEGAPGNGKTSLAEAIAAESMLPFYAVRYEGIVSSFLGETAGRIDQVFEFARTRRCVLFFDEFDTIAKERADEHETGEIKRVVSTLLLQIDRLPSHVIVVAATNHGELLDRAAWRRFQLRLALQPPSRGRRRVPRRPTDTVRRRARSRAVYPRRPPAWCQLRRARAVRPGRPPPVRARAARRRPDRDREEPAEPVADPGPPMTRERR